jgi:flavin reductase (DIM6/NTAB) family NADH-FMN oxidoreductase RutF
MHAMKIERRPATALLPVPAVLVSVADPRTRRRAAANIITLAWTGTVCSAPPMLSIAVRPSRYSYELLQRTHDFVVNVPRASQVEMVDYCGHISGRDLDKFKECKLHALPSTRVSSPLIEECPINLECVTRHRLSLGAHDLFVAEIVAVHYDDDVVDSRGRLVPAKVDALAYVHGEYRRLGEKVGSYGFALKKRKE